MGNRNEGSRRAGAAWGSIVCAVLLACSSLLGQEEEQQQPLHPLIGAEVIGPGSRTLGFVADVVIDRSSGEVAMYLVKVRGWFGDYGVIPVGNFESQTPSQRPGEVAPALSADVNRATFVNIAKWDGSGSFGRYLDEYQSILSTVFDLDRERLALGGSAYVLLSRTEGDQGEMTAESSPRR